MKLYAISDLHLSHKANRQALINLPAHPDDWLIVVGDVGETFLHLHVALTILTERFARVFWTPGNHDLWTIPSDKYQTRGVAKYEQLVSICREYNVLTPEDPYVEWTGDGGRHLIVPAFMLYDYSFRPPDVPLTGALAWAAEAGIMAVDETYLYPDPYSSRSEWCAARCQYTEARLAQTAPDVPIVLAAHFPLRYDLAYLPRIPRFSLWCGTQRTESWLNRFPISTVLYGHLHIRQTQIKDGVRFEEVSLGYPKQWSVERGLKPYLRQILP